MHKIIWNFILLNLTLLVTSILSDKANASDKIISTTYSSYNGDYNCRDISL